MTTGRVALVTAAVAIVVGGVLAVTGVPLGLVVLFTAVIVAGGAVMTALVDPEEPTLPEPPAPLRGGARREIAFVAQSMRAARGRIAPNAALRLRAVAAHRLARRGIDLADPADRARAEAALGARAYAVVTMPATQSIGTLRATIRAIERLPDADPGRAPVVRRPAAGTASDPSGTSAAVPARSTA